MARCAGSPGQGGRCRRRSIGPVAAPAALRPFEIHPSSKHVLGGPDLKPAKRRNINARMGQVNVKESQFDQPYLQDCPGRLRHRRALSTTSI